VRTARRVIEAVAEPSRVRLLQALIDPASVTELVSRTGLGQANISNHLSRLRASRLVRGEKRGRVVEYRLADATVAQFVESLSALAGPPPLLEQAALSEARTCYDHLAGRLGVALFDGLVASGALRDERRADGSLRLGPHAHRVFGKLGLNLETLAPNRRRLAYKCLDWTERRAHLGGALGATVAASFLSQGLVRRRRGNRGLDVAPRAWIRIESLTRRSQKGRATSDG
jgi:DNA-binding transcriptional ArsR family regulator